jgi:hypothetical protein
MSRQQEHGHRCHCCKERWYVKLNAPRAGIRGAMLPPQNSEAPKLAVANTSQFNKGASDDATVL